MKKTITVLLMIGLISVWGCRTKDGAPGPVGTAGTSGTNGVNGTNGTNNLLNQGSISGTLYYLNYLGDSVKSPFNYQYYASVLDNEFTYYDSADYNASVGELAPGYTFNFKRRDLNDSSNICSFSVSVIWYDKSNPTYLSGPLSTTGAPVSPATFNSSFSFSENLNNNLFSFSDGGGLSYGGETNNTTNYGSTCDISNFSLDTLTGKLMFDFIITYNANDITPATEYDNSHPAIIKGTVDVVLVRNQPSLIRIQEIYHLT